MTYAVSSFDILNSDWQTGQKNTTEGNPIIMFIYICWLFPLYLNIELNFDSSKGAFLATRGSETTLIMDQRINSVVYVLKVLIQPMKFTRGKGLTLSRNFMGSLSILTYTTESNNSLVHNANCVWLWDQGRITRSISTIFYILKSNVGSLDWR